MKIIDLFQFTKLRFLRFSKIRNVLAVFSLFLVLGMYYAGSGFLAHFNSAVPSGAAGGPAVIEMKPGDHFEQFYRYLLPKNNLMNGRPLYESGYQYNLDKTDRPFTEGLVFFPFSLFVSLLAFLVGDIVAYNTMALLSFPLVGGAMYFLVFRLTRSWAAALLSSLLLALLPHRTGFLFGEMVYGVDLCFPPLIIYAFEQLLRTKRRAYVIYFGLFCILYTTANFQGFYLFAVFSIPYFAARTTQILMQSKGDAKLRLIDIGLLTLSLAPSAAYMLHVAGLMSASGLDKGQNYQELYIYAPQISNIFTVWSGNEKTIYLGWTLFFPITAILWFGLSRSSTWLLSSRGNLSTSTLPFATLTFLIAYAFCFGPNMDKVLGVGIFRWYFDHIPGASGTRTTGRLMNTAGFYFAFCTGLVVQQMESKWAERRRRSPLLWTIAVILATFFIVFDFKYTKPIMSSTSDDSSIYNSLRNHKGIIYTIPTQFEAAHYLNSTYLYYATKYNLKMFAGHSSMYPKEWNTIIPTLYDINSGQFNEEQWNIFKKRGITHLVAHETTFEPHVSSTVVALLRMNPYLEYISVDRGIHLFALRLNVNLNSGQLPASERLTLVSKYISAMDRGKAYTLNGWYAREVYPGQKPFRWMKGGLSKLMYIFSDARASKLQFDYKCPLESLELQLNDRNVDLHHFEEKLPDGWSRVNLDISSARETGIILDLTTPAIFKSPPDTRSFGCQVGDFSFQ